MVDWTENTNYLTNRPYGQEWNLRKKKKKEKKKERKVVLTTVFQSIYDLVHQKWRPLKEAKRRPWELLVCVWQSVSVTSSKAGMCGRNVQYVMHTPFSALHWQRASQHGRVLRSSNSKQKNPKKQTNKKNPKTKPPKTTTKKERKKKKEKKRKENPQKLDQKTTTNKETPMSHKLHW